MIGINTTNTPNKNIFNFNYHHIHAEINVIEVLNERFLEYC